MKKLLAILLAMMLVMVSVAAMAATVTPSQTKTFTFDKEYTVISTGSNISIPKDTTLKFTATLNDIKDSTLTVDKASDAVKKIEFSAPIDETATTGDKKFTAAISGTIPSYPAVGIYTYELVESGDTPAGVVYSANTYMKVIVLAKGNALEVGSISIREVADPTNQQHDTLKVDEEGKPVVDKDGNPVYEKSTTKLSEITNEYAAGSLLIKKVVDGNLGDKQLPFEMTVTFTSQNVVNGAITITTSGAMVTKIDDTAVATQPTTIAGNGWKTKKVTFELKDSDTILFENVPATVTYEVTETKAGQDGYTTKIEGSDMEQAIDGAIATSKGSGSITVDTIPAEKEGEKATKAVVADTITITNTKDIIPDTGITLETLPYVLMMALAMMGLVALKLRKREEY